ATTRCRRTSPTRSSSSTRWSTTRRPPGTSPIGALAMPKTTPVTFASPVKPSGWTWEATNREVANRYNLPLEQVGRFDQNTAPMPPGAVKELLRGAEFEVELSEYPPSDYGRLVEAASKRYGVAAQELLVGAGADEVLDLVAKTFIAHGGAAVVPV